MNRRAAWRLATAPLLAAISALLLGACTSGQGLQVEAALSREVISPNGANRPDGATTLRYTLSGPARVSVAVRDPSGRQYFLRQDEPRPSAGAYQLQFDGTYAPGEDPLNRRVLGDGQYELVVSAIASDGRRASASAPLRVQDADTDPPRLDPLVVSPTAISPNFDAIDDVLAATFRLSKEALVSIYVEDASGRKVDVRLLDEKRLPGEYVEFWDGVVNDKPLADGLYAYIVSARDRAGNVTTIRTPVQVAAGGIPRAKILRADFAPRRILLGGSVHVRMRVKNVGETVLRTQGPDSGFVYSSYESFGSIEDGAFIDRAGLWRAGVDWAGAPISGGARYPYRWGFGHDLPPGEEVDITGEIQMWHRITRLFLFAGIIQEGARIHDDGVGRAQIEISF